MGWCAGRAEPQEIRNRRFRLLGISAVPQVRLSQRVPAGRRWTRAPQLDTAYVESEIRGRRRHALAPVREPRILPRIQRQATSPRSTWPVRLRASAKNAKPLDF